MYYDQITKYTILTKHQKEILEAYNQGLTIEWTSYGKNLEEDAPEGYKVSWESFTKVVDHNFVWDFADYRIKTNSSLEEGKNETRR